MKKSRFLSVLIGVVLVAFIAVTTLFLLFGNAEKTGYAAYAEEMPTEQPAGEQEGVQSGETKQDGEAPEESGDAQPDVSNDVEFDLEAFLAYVQKYADQAGVGNDYAKAVEAIKTAASKKQVTLSTIASVAEFVALLVYIIYLNTKNGRLKKTLVYLGEKLDAQVKGTNGLIDESNENGQTTAQTQKDVEALKRSMSALIAAFSTFADRFNIGAASKESVRREFNRAAKEIDGERETSGQKDKETADDEKNQTF